LKNSVKKRILVVEDDAHIGDGLKLNLSLHGYEVDIAVNGPTAIQKWKTWLPDLIVLDIMLPGIDGLSVLKSIRLEDERMPILILSARSASEDKIEGLTCGVDDYMTKPFNLDEFLLRVERLLTRVSWSKNNSTMENLCASAQTYSFGGNHIDFKSSLAGGRHGQFRLTEQEVKLLKLFIANRGRPLSREKLLEIGWGYSGKTSTRTVDNFMVRLRKYFEKNPKKPIFFKSLRSLGYIFEHEKE